MMLILQIMITDIAANAQHLDNINKMADRMVTDDHSLSRDIRKRQKDINDQYVSFLSVAVYVLV